MTRGNQRDIDRQRAAARTAKAGGGKKDDGLTPQQRNERDAKAMAEKRAKKKESEGDKKNPNPNPASQKKKKDDVSSLLSEGLKRK